MHPLIDASELRGRLERPDLRLCDVRFSLADPEAGRRAYAEAHVPGAVYLHLDDDLSAPVGRHGGRHPLPAPEDLARTLGRAGIDERSHVVAVDDGDGMAAPRLWWLLQWLGHARVQVLDGGMPAYLRAGGAVTDEVPQPSSASFVPRPNRDMVVDRDWLVRHLHDPSLAIADVRAPERFRGDVEPIDPVGGHIPGAVNRPYLEDLEGGRFRSAAELSERYADLRGAGTVVLYCGSGVTAAQGLLALTLSGLPVAKLYAGSWSDWVSYADAPVETGAGREALGAGERAHASS